MKHNVCGLDRRLRIALGLALLGLALGPDDGEDAVSLPSVLAGYGAAEFLLINGLLQWCPLNYALGIDTCERDWPARLRGDSAETRSEESESAGVVEHVLSE